jgi:hypothetical protein
MYLRFWGEGRFRPFSVCHTGRGSYWGLELLPKAILSRKGAALVRPGAWCYDMGADSLEGRDLRGFSLSISAGVACEWAWMHGCMYPAVLVADLPKAGIRTAPYGGNYGR